MRWAGSTKSKVNVVLEVTSDNTDYFSIRSSSVIFVPAESSYGGIPSMSGAKDLTNPYLGGFGFSRPETARPRGHYFTVAHGQITLDCYHHPSKRWDPSLRYIQAFDLYSYVQYPLLDLVILIHQRHLTSTHTTALNFSSRHLLTGYHSLVSVQSSSNLVCGNRLKPLGQVSTLKLYSRSVSA